MKEKSATQKQKFWFYKRDWLSENKNLADY